MWSEMELLLSTYFSHFSQHRHCVNLNCSHEVSDVENLLSNSAKILRCVRNVHMLARDVFDVAK